MIWFLRMSLMLGVLLGTWDSVAQGRTQVRLALSASQVQPGDSIMAGFEMTMPPNWHTYWKNPGESGAAAKVTWALPDTVTAGEIQWPLPEKLVMAGLTTFVYHEKVVLLVPLRVSNAAKGDLELKAKISWLECEEQCVPGQANVSAMVTVGEGTLPSADAPLLFAWKKKVPPANPNLVVRAAWEKPGDESRPLVLEWKPTGTFKLAEFLSYPAENFDVAPTNEVLSLADGIVRLRKTVNKFEGEWPKQMSGVVTMARTSDGTVEAYEVSFPIGTEPLAPAATAATAPPKPVAATRSVAAPAPSLLGMLMLAFLGGLILNIMPCVLPVIALKVLGFVQQSKENPALVRKHGLVYGVGVLTSFLALAAMVIAVKQAGGSASWGMQMQNPHFRFVLLVIVSLVALNLFGVFEITLGGGAMGTAAQLASKEGAAGAFFNGVLATALATPCTAPALASAVGFAFAQPPLVILLVFSAIAAGLTIPYVVLSFKPGWMKFLPKPGLWMQRFKVAMGFPMLATAVWLFDLTAGSFGDDGPLWIGLFLVVLALAAWIWGEFVQKGAQRKSLAIALCVLLLGSAYGFALEHELNWRKPVKKAASGIIQTSPEGIPWIPWTTAAVEKARAEGRPVLVDFTAKWCLTCKANKRTSIEIASVRAKLREINAATFIADNTDPSPEINVELQKYERAGVPLVLVFPKDASKPPLVLPALLTPGIVLKALDEAVR